MIIGRLGLESAVMNGQERTCQAQGLMHQFDGAEYGYIDTCESPLIHRTEQPRCTHYFSCSP